MSIQTPPPPPPPRRVAIKVSKLGVTSSQMINAPINSVYVWMNSNLLYPRRLANYLGRSDFIVKSCNDVFYNDTWHGAKQGIVIDHSVYDHCSSRVFDGISRYKQWKSSL